MRRERITSLEVIQLTQKFENSELFSDLNIKFELGQTHAFMGEPGCGKSIFLKMLTGLVEPTEGCIRYNNKDLNEISFENSIPMRLSTAICFENGGLLMNKTLEENLKLSLLYHNQWRAERSQRLYDELVSEFKIKKFLHLRPAQVSSGVRKITGLARVFLLNPQVIILDEPSLGIGPEATIMLKKQLEKFRLEHSDNTVLMATQDIAFTKLINAQVWEIKNKTIKKAAA